jgi:hypothetical protein
MKTAITAILENKPNGLYFTEIKNRLDYTYKLLRVLREMEEEGTLICRRQYIAEEGTVCDTWTLMKIYLENN